MKRNILIGILFALGLGVLLYPVFSNFIMVGTHATVISEYEDEVEKLSDDELKKATEKAKEYNETKVNDELVFTDPFGDGEATIDAGYYNVLDVGETIGSIEIPKIDTELPIYHGVSSDVLDAGIGHLSNSSFPIGGKGTHSILSGHRGLPTAKMFRELDKLELGDQFYIHVLDKVLAYEVVDISIVLPNETNNLKLEEGKDLVTLVTCEPYMINTHRLLVKAERVPYVAAETPEVRKPLEEPQKFSVTKEQLIISLAVILLLLFIFILIRRNRKKKKRYSDET